MHLRFGVVGPRLPIGDNAMINQGKRPYGLAMATTDPDGSTGEILHARCDKRAVAVIAMVR